MKHLALVAVLAHLRKKDKPFAVIDTHAGRGLYDLAGEARRTGEAAAGIGQARAIWPAARSASRTYLEAARDGPANPIPARR